MNRRVYQFGCLSPSAGELLVREQLRTAHEYQNDLIAIERGRRHALRLVDATDEVREAESVVRAATKATHTAAIAALRAARRAARATASDELARIQALDDSIRRGARALTRCYWGSYLDIEARHQQSRSAPLYADDAVTPSDPHFRRWSGKGQLGVQLQCGLSTRDALSGTDTRVKLVLGPPQHRGRQYGVLWMRIGSDGGDPVWAQWPIKCHRSVPDSAIWKWVRISLRREGLREQWSVEITVDDPASRARDLDTDLTGCIAVEWEWSPLDDGGLRVARWCDDHGQSGVIVLPAQIATGIRKPDGIRAVRDIVLNDLRPKLQRALQERREPLPSWLAEAAATMHLWKSPGRFRDLAARWRRERCDAARVAYEMLDAWEMGTESHLYAYESSARGEALRERREWYRLLAARWARQYRTVLLSDQNLSREARWGDDGDRRFTAGVHQLRGALQNAFGDESAVLALWRDAPSETDERTWCERTRDAWVAGGARGDGRFAKRQEKTLNAWAKRKAAKAAKRAGQDTARNVAANTAE
jgi:hypothetical protein